MGITKRWSYSVKKKNKMKKIVNFLLILILILFSPLENKVDAINQQEKKKFIVILNPNYKVKDIIGLDVIGNGSGKIKRKQIIRPLKNKTNLKRKLNKLEKKQKQITNEIQKRKIKKRINRLKRKVKNFNKLKATGKLDYKNRTFIIKFDNSIPDNFIINSLKSHPAINAIAKDYKIKSTALPNDPYVNNGSGDWTMEPNKQSIAIRTSNTDENGYDFYRSDLEKMWYLKTIQMDEVWKKSNTINGNGVVVAVIDSGQNMTHEDGQNIWINTDEYGNGKESNGIDDDPFSTDISNNPDNFVTTYVDDYQGWDYVDKDNIPNDDNGHGAHVSGTIAGSGNNGKGIIGIAPSANIMVLKTLAGNGSGSMSDIISALDYAINQGADIINMSLGSDKRESVDLTSDAINIIQNNLFSEAKAQGIVICIAAGNNRASHSSTGYSSPGEIYNNDLTKAYSPAWFAVNHSNLITVAATTWGNTEAEKQVNGSWQPNSLNESLANFSNFSSRKANAITVGAPGVHMYSLSHTSNSGYVIQQGTSMASPVVAGLAALIMGINDKLSPEEVVSIIKNNTDKTTGTDLNNSHYVGAGRINALKAVNAALESNIKITSPTNNPTINSPNITISGTAQASTALQLFINQSPVGNTFNSSADGNFTTSATFTSDGVNSIFITGEINGNNMTSNTISVTLDIFRPKIITPTSNITITSPTFNITGTTSPNTVVKIYKKQLNTNQFISSENVTNNGTYSINIQPHFSDFSKTVVYFASANVKVGSNITSKQSSPITLNFNIKDYPPEINFPSNNTIIYSPTFNIKGKAKAGESIQLVIDGVLSEKTTANGTLLNGFQDFTFEKTNSGQKTFLNSPQSILPIQKSYKVSSNVYQQPRESNSILLTFDVYKPIISQPENGITISTPTFNIIGKTEPNAKVSILKNGQTLITTTANASGTYNATIRYEFDGNTLTYTSSANVTISGSQTIKTDIKTYSFNVPDTRPLISSPTNLETIQSKKFTLRGTTSGNTLVTLYANGNPTSIQSYSDPSGNFTIPVTSSASGSSSFKVKANIYNKDYFSNQIQINFNVNTNAPNIEYPNEGTII
ncbi:MAG: S8 family serine peptidase, partial [Candidatus Margulisiibacteriota bacterium]